MKLRWPWRRHVAIVRRKAALQRELQALLGDSAATPEQIKRVTALHEEVAKFLASQRRRRSLRWLLGLAAGCVAAAAALSLIRVRDPRFVLNASATSFVYGVGREDERLADSLPVTTVSFQGESYCTEKAANLSCAPARSLELRSLVGFAGSEVRWRKRRDCQELAFLSGGGLLQIGIDDTPAPKFVRLGELDEIRFCGAPSATLVIRQPRYFVVGDVTADPIGERILLPAARTGTVLLADADMTRSLRSTEVVRLAGLQETVASVQIADTMDIAATGRGGRIEVLRSTSKEDIGPTWLDSLQGSPKLKAWLGILVGTWTGLALLRNRLEDLVT